MLDEKNYGGEDVLTTFEAGQHLSLTVLISSISSGKNNAVTEKFRDALFKALQMFQKMK